MAKYTGHPITDDSALGGAVIQRSLRFNDSDSAYLNRTPSSAGDRRTWTWSGWVKRANSTTNMNLFSVREAADVRTIIRITDGLDFLDDDINFRLKTNAKFRDFNAWYHFVVVSNTTDSTSSNRLKVYVNGEQITSFSTETYPSQNYEGQINTTNEHALGREGGTDNDYLDGYMAEVNFVDGYAYDPSYFGYTESQTGLWRPKRYEGTYGTNGFYLDFSDNSSTSALGIDKSPNGNDWSVNNFTTGANLVTNGEFNSDSDWTKDSSWTISGGKASNSGGGEIYQTFAVVSGITYIMKATVDATGDSSLGNTSIGFRDTGDTQFYAYKATFANGSFTDLTANAVNEVVIPWTSTVTGNVRARCYSSDTITIDNWSVIELADSVTDTPTNNFCTLNPIQYGTGNATKVTISNGNLNFSDSSSSNKAAVSTFGLKSGKYYFELLSTNTGTYSIGMTDLTTNNGSFYRNNGSYSSSFGGSGTSGYASWTTNDVIGVAVDFDNGKIWYAKNNTWQSGDPSTGNSPTNTFTSGLTLNVEIYTDNSSGTKSGSLNFGQQRFSFTPPTGYRKLNSKNLPPNVPSIIRPQKQFDTLEYTGQDTSSLYNVTGLEFTPDFVWAKTINGTIGHIMIDTVRGDDRQIQGDVSDAEVVRGTPSYRFLKDGFAVGTGGNMNNPKNYVAYCWKAGGAAVSNTDGSITTSVSANTEAGFSIVKFALTSNAVYTVGHGLGKVPQWIMMKALSGGDNSGTTNWDCYHVAIGNTKRFKLNSRDAAEDYTGPWNDTTPTSSVFTSTGSWLGGNGTNVIAYCWTEIPGFSKFGSYTGNGNSDGPYVHLGFRPAWLLIKADLSESWYLFDNKRDVDNEVNQEFRVDHEYASGTFTIGDFLSNGFKIRATDSAANGSGSTYTYIAFAEQPGTTPFDTFPNAR